MPGALSGIRVIERAAGPAAAFAGRLLAVCGARVVMVEPPGGSPLRSEPPLVAVEPRISALFAYLAAGKESAVCDLTVADGRAGLDEMLANADILIDDTPVADREARGLDPERVCTAFPTLIFVSVLPFGAAGPRANWRAGELGCLHAGGEGYLMPNGLANEIFPDRPPVKIYGEFASFQGGTAAATGAIAALYARAVEGGQFLDISIQDANVAESTVAIQRWGDGILETRETRAFRYGGVLECQGGYVEVLTLEQHQWQALKSLVGEWEGLDLARLDDPLERARHGAQINQCLRDWAKRHPVDEVVRRGRECGVPIAPYSSPQEILADPHERERGLFTSVPIPGDGPRNMLLAPFQFSATPTTLRSGPPSLAVAPESLAEAGNG